MRVDHSSPFKDLFVLLILRFFCYVCPRNVKQGRCISEMYSDFFFGKNVAYIWVHLRPTCVFNVNKHCFRPETRPAIGEYHQSVDHWQGFQSKNVKFQCFLAISFPAYFNCTNRLCMGAGLTTESISLPKPDS